MTAKDGSILDNVSSTRDERKHSVLRRAVANAYALGTLIEYEPLVDSTSLCFFRELEARFVKTEQECPLSKWVQMYAFDIMSVVHLPFIRRYKHFTKLDFSGELTFSKRFGFLESNEDIGDMMHHTAGAMDYIGIVRPGRPVMNNVSPY